MEKKTIGKFISALRRAGGMTQRELGDKLFVSDKTVSRWECDECTPELSLIPAIAEIFGITADELLRGERNNPHRGGQNQEEAETKPNAKSDRQIRLMLDNTRRKHQNLTLISVGITIFGIISASVANLAFSKGLIAFCLCMVFSVAAVICQICFTVNNLLTVDEDKALYGEKILFHNTNIVKKAVGVSFFNIGAIAFCLPLVTLINGANYGLEFGYWILHGALFTLIGIILTYVIYMFFVERALRDKGLITESEEKIADKGRKRALLKKVTTVALAIGLIICVGGITLDNAGVNGLTKKRVFNTCEDFKHFMESDYDAWLAEGNTYYDSNGNKVTEIPAIPDDGKVDEGYTLNKKYGEILNSDGEVICEYYYNPGLYKRISFTLYSDDKMPVTVITYEDYYKAKSLYDMLEATIVFLIISDVAIASVIYLAKIYKWKNEKT